MIFRSAVATDITHVTKQRYCSCKCKRLQWIFDDSPSNFKLIRQMAYLVYELRRPRKLYWRECKSYKTNKIIKN